MSPRDSRIAKLVSRRRGSALLAAAVFVAIVGMTVASVMNASNRQIRNTYRSRLFNTSLAAASTAVHAMTEQAYFVATTRPAQLGGDFTKLDEAILNIKPKPIPGYVSVKNGNKALSFMKAKGANNGDYEVINDSSDDWNGFNIQRWRYDAVAFMNEGDEKTGTVDGNASRMGFQGAGFKSDLEINFIPLYQYAIFYDNDLEIHNGPVMTVKGPVHTNRTLWVASGSGLNFEDRVSAAAGFRSYNDFTKVETNSTVARINTGTKDSAAAKAVIEESAGHTANLTIKNGAGVATTMNNSSISALDSNKNLMLDSLDTNWLSNALSRYNGKLQDSAMGIKPIKPPLPYIETNDGTRQQAEASELIQRASINDNASMKEAKMEYKADLIIEGSPKDSVYNSTTKEYSNITIRDRNGTTYPNKVTRGGSDYYIVKPGSFYDNREGKLVNTFDIDMSEINARATSLPIKNGNGLLYASPTGSSTVFSAVRVTNGATMPANVRNTMTVATDKPMYLAGDINTAANRTTLLLAADAITVISQGQTLTEANTVNSGKPTAKGKTVTNAIFMLGQVSSKYDSDKTKDHWVNGQRRTGMSGGAHNVLRYLENWDGVVHQFNGSLICLFESRLANSIFWRNGGAPYYNPPKREYNWDASLRTKEPPAGMPVLVQVKSNRIERISKAQAIALAN